MTHVQYFRPSITGLDREHKLNTSVGVEVLQELGRRAWISQEFQRHTGAKTGGARRAYHVLTRRVRIDYPGYDAVVLQHIPDRVVRGIMTCAGFPVVHVGRL